MFYPHCVTVNHNKGHQNVYFWLLFSNSPDWCSPLRDDVRLTVVSVPLSNREVPMKEAKDFAESIAAIFIETSARNAVNVEELFQKISRFQNCVIFIFTKYIFYFWNVMLGLLICAYMQTSGKVHLQKYIKKSSFRKILFIKSVI